MGHAAASVPPIDSARVDAAWKAIRADGSIQFDLPEKAVPPRDPPPEWLEPVLRAIGEFVQWVGGGWRVILWIVGIVIVAALLFAIVPGLREWLAERLGRRRVVEEAPVWVPTETRARAVLEDADALAGKGRYDEAVRLLLFRSIDDIVAWRGDVVRPADTSRDIARADALPPRARRVRRDRRGGRAQPVRRAGAGRRRLAARARRLCRFRAEGRGVNPSSPFAVRTVVMLVIGGALLLLASILMSGFGDEIARAAGDAPAADRKDGAGYHAFRRLVDAVQPPRAAVTEPIVASPILILTPTAASRPEEVKAIVDRRIALAEKAGEDDDTRPLRYPTLLILPKWRVEKLPLQDRVQRTGEVNGTRVMQLIPTRVEQHTEDRGDIGVAAQDYPGLRPFALPDRPVRAAKGPALYPLIGARDGAAVLGQVGSGDTFVLVDPDLVNNRALADERNARAALAMLRAIDPEHDGRAVFDKSLHYARGDRNLVKLLFLPPFLGVTLALIAAAVLAGIAAAGRFGPPVAEKRAVAAGKRALIDNIVALTRLAGRTPQVGPRYADTMLEVVSRRLLIGGTPSAERLERIHPGYADIDRRLRDARTESEALAAARDLTAWKKETGA